MLFQRWYKDNINFFGDTQNSETEYQLSESSYNSLYKYLKFDLN